MPAPRSAPENPTNGLFYIPGDHDVVVTGEEHHQPALQPYAPLADGRARQVAVELVPAPIARGTHAGKPGIELRLDGRRIGELTRLMAGRYGPLVAEVQRRGGRPACTGLVDHGKRGLEVVLQLPDVRAGAAPGPAPDRPTTVLPQPSPPAARRRRRRAPLLIGAGVVTLLVVIGASVGGGAEPERAADSTLAAPATPALTTTTPPPTTVAPPPPPPETQRAVAQPRPQPQSQPQSQSQPQPQPRPQSQPQPQPRPQPAPPPEPEPDPPASDCDPNYSGACVPVASDVDCEGGTGNGPAYVSGPVRITGEDVYGLDGRDNDGIGCE